MIVIQARLDSTRWPKKALVKLDGIPMIDRVYKQCQLSDIRPVIVAIPADDLELGEHCQHAGYCTYLYGGERNDLIGRYWGALQEYGGDRVLRITADCPYHFPQEIAWVWSNGQIDDFTSNGWPEGRTTPDGVDAEVYSRRLLKWMYENVTDKRYREHLPLYLYEHEAELKSKFYLNRVDWAVDFSNVKFSMDRPEDYENIKKAGLI